MAFCCTPDNRSRQDQLTQVQSRCLEKLLHKLDVFAGQYPAACSVNGVYPLTHNTDWTTGFWSGITWLGWQMSDDNRFLSHFQRQLPGFRHRIDCRHDIETHDLGFLYSLSCVNAWRTTGDHHARDTALRAADLLVARYHPAAQIIQAWGDLQDPHQQGRMIIDCMMNLPLLYWATEQTGNPEYAQLAGRHAVQASRYLIRPDRSTFHTFYMDVTTGEPLRGSTHQGYSDTSCWARGQAWAVYGFALSYSYTGNTRFLHDAVETAHYFLSHLPEDRICYWDLSLTAEETARDSSAAAIAVCGLLEIVRHLSVLDADSTYFIREALLIMDALCQHYYQGDLPHNGFLTHAVYNMNKARGVDEYCLWGDYFFLEALSRLSDPLNKYW